MIYINTSFEYKTFLMAREVNEKLLGNFYAWNTGKADSFSILYLTWQQTRLLASLFYKKRLTFTNT